MNELDTLKIIRTDLYHTRRILLYSGCVGKYAELFSNINVALEEVDYQIYEIESKPTKELIERCKKELEGHSEFLEGMRKKYNNAFPP